MDSPRSLFLRPSSLRPLLLGVVLFIVSGGVGGSDAMGQETAGYYETTEFLGAPATAFREGLLGYANPALPALSGSHVVAAWSTKGRRAGTVQDWGVFGGAGPLGLSVVRRRPGDRRMTGYHVSLAGGSADGAFGLGYHRTVGDATALGYHDRLKAGSVIRPNSYLSVGLMGGVSLETDHREVVSEIGVRPLGSSRLTLFGDAAWAAGQALVDVPWSVGAAVEVVPGLDFRGRLFDTEAVALGLRVELGRTGLDSQSQFDANQTYAGQVNRIRTGAYRPSAIAQGVNKGDDHVELSLTGPVGYRGTRFSELFGGEASRFYDILRTVQDAGESDRVVALVLNLSGIDVGPELAWELRTALEEARERGVTVIAYLERGGITAYHLASGADVIALHPQGMLTLPGYAMSRTFVHGTLSKLGLGVQAWRFFEYKSAFEQLSRTDYSPADSLQRQKYVDDQYELTRDEVADARPIASDSLDRLIDEKLVLTGREAQEAGLVDTLARWDERSDLLEAVTDASTSALSVDHLANIATATQEWSSPDEIAVVYGIGGTQVEGGMGSRSLSERIRRLAKNDDVAAVVFRVDSPGGSPVAAAQVGDAIKACAKEKPVIVTQGQVAASGGYWVSTHADTILAGPNTVTGSIGVIGGWIYDDGFGTKTGLSSDVVQRGERADLLEGLRLPLVGLSVPTRKLTEEEMMRVKSVIEQGYDEFVATVAEGRDTTEAHIREVGEGRIYSGLDGKEVGLVDEVGGLPRAIETARLAAGLAPEEVRVREVNPFAGTVDFGRFLPSPLARLLVDERSKDGTEAAIDSDPTHTYIRLILEHQPQPLVLLPPGYHPTIE